MIGVSKTYGMSEFVNDGASTIRRSKGWIYVVDLERLTREAA